MCLGRSVCSDRIRLDRIGSALWLDAALKNAAHTGKKKERECLSADHWPLSSAKYSFNCNRLCGWLMHHSGNGLFVLCPHKDFFHTCTWWLLFNQPCKGKSWDWDCQLSRHHHRHWTTRGLVLVVVMMVMAPPPTFCVPQEKLVRAMKTCLIFCSFGSGTCTARWWLPSPWSSEDTDLKLLLLLLLILLLFCWD